MISRAAILAALVASAHASPLADVPLEIGPPDQRSAQPDHKAYVTFTIGDVKARLFLDLGNPTATIDLSPALLAKARVQFTGEVHPIRDYQGRSYNRRMFIVPRGTLGGWSFTNVHGAEQVLRPEADGTFSLALFTGHVVLVDYPARRLAVYDPAGLPALLAGGGWAEGRSPPDSAGGFQVLLQLDGVDQAFDFGLDNAAIATDAAGNDFNLIRARSPLGIYLDSHGLIHRDHAEPGTIGRFSSTGFRWNHQPLGPSRFMVVDYALAPDDGLLGFSFFLQHAVLFDLPRHRVFMK